MNNQLDPYHICLLCRESNSRREVPPTVSSLKGKNASLNFECSQNVYISQVIRYVPASKHRLCDTTKAKLVRSTPKTFQGLGLYVYLTDNLRRNSFPLRVILENVLI